jgi:hypothetical protein
MAVIVEGISVIIKASAIIDKYPGGWESFKARVPNNTLCADGELIRIGFMAPNDVKAIIDDLMPHGIIYLQDKKSQDLVVVDQIRGFAAKCEWAEFGKIDWQGDPKKKVSACRAVGSKIEEVLTPDGWDYDRSLSKHFKFIQTEEKYERLIFLEHKNGCDVYIDLETGKEVFVGRANP